MSVLNEITRRSDRSVSSGSAAPVAESGLVDPLEARAREARGIGALKGVVGEITNNFGGTPGENTANGIATAMANAAGRDTAEDSAVQGLGKVDTGLALGVGLTNALSANAGRAADPRKNANFNKLSAEQQLKATADYQGKAKANDKAGTKALLKTAQGGAKVVGSGVRAGTKGAEVLGGVASGATGGLMGLSAVDNLGDAFQRLKKGEVRGAVDSAAVGADLGARGVAASAGLAEAIKGGSTGGFAASASAAVPMVEGAAQAAMLPGKVMDTGKALAKGYKLRKAGAVTKDNVAAQEQATGRTQASLHEDHVASVMAGKGVQRGFERRNSVRALRDAMDVETARKYGVGAADTSAVVNAVDTAGTAANAVGSFTAAGDMGITKAVGVGLQGAASGARFGQTMMDRASAVSNAVDASDVAKGYNKAGLISKAGKGIKNGIGKVTGAIGRGANAAGTAIDDAWDARDQLGNAGIAGKGSLAGLALLKGGKDGAKLLGKGVKGAAGLAGKGLKAAGSVVSGAASSAYETVGDGVAFVGKKLKGFGGKVKNKVMGLASSAAEGGGKLGSWLGDKADAAGTAIDNGWDAAVSGSGPAMAGPMGGVARGGALMGMGMLKGGKELGKLAGKGMGKVADGAKYAGGKVADGAKWAGNKVMAGLGAAGRGIGKAVSAVGRGVGKVAKVAGKGVGAAVGAVPGAKRAGNYLKENLWETQDMKWARKAGGFFSTKSSGEQLAEAEQAWEADAGGHVDALRGDRAGAEQILDIEERLKGSKRKRYAGALDRARQSDNEGNKNAANTVLKGLLGDKAAASLDEDAMDDSADDIGAILSGKDAGSTREGNRKARRQQAIYDGFAI